MTLTDLYEEYETYLRGYALRLGHDAQQADDLVQETFIRAMGHLELLKLLKPYQRRAWLSRTLKNLFLDEQKSRQRQEVLVDPLTWENPAASYLPQEVMAPNPFDLVPEQYRDLFKKQYILGMTSQEIAVELGIPAATVRSRLHLAMKVLRTQKSKLK
ncbi:MAG: RNA polymerase sigma factor [Chloroflexi bacterium]|nr:RNA polymerase sigma factor [Chloroflexota bacterium]